MSVDELQDEQEHEIYDLVAQYYQDWHKKDVNDFIPRYHSVPVSGKVFDEKEMIYLTKAMLDFWLTDGEMCKEFAEKLEKVTQKRHAILCNSGSSANLLAITAMKEDINPETYGPIGKGPHILTPAVGFPTTLAPIIQNGMVPVLVDVEIGTYVPNANLCNEAVNQLRIEGVVMPHTLGNVAPILNQNVLSFDWDVFTLYDCCDALGSQYKDKPVTAYGDYATLSFYPAHHITTGEGGAVLVNNGRTKKIIESYRDWGRDCWCATGCDNTCNKRYDWRFPNLPKGYDHKYVYSRLGYNLKMTDLQAAIGIPQLRKLPMFIQARKDNFAFYQEFFGAYENFFHLPQATPDSDPAWFGYPLTIRDDAPFDREELIRYLGECKIGTRLLFGGNLLRQPAFQGTNHLVYGSLENANKITENTFWIGVYPGITPLMREYVVDCFCKFYRTL